MLKSFFHTSAYLFCGLIVVLFWPPLMFLLRLVDWSGSLANTMARWGLALLSIFCGARLDIAGQENLDKKQNYLILANHKSSVDIPILARILPIHFRFFASSHLFSIPLFGWGMYLAGYLPVNRSNRSEAYISIHKGIQILAQDQASLLIFPEGTRSEKPIIQPFKQGFLRIATDTQRPILPVILADTSDIKKKSESWYHPARIKISILAPISTEGLLKEQWPELRQEMETLFRTEFEAMLAAKARSDSAAREELPQSDCADQ